MEVVEGGVKAQIEQVFKNFTAITAVEVEGILYLGD